MEPAVPAMSRPARRHGSSRAPAPWDSTGSFDLTMTLDEVDKLPTCDGTGAFVAQTIVIAGAGIVSLK